MRAVLALSLASVWNRRVAAGLTVIAIAMSVALLLGVEKLRRDARDAFANTISGTDLIVGARSGAIQLLLYSVFRVGNATSNVSWKSFEHWSRDPRVAWAVPLSLGDSHRGYRVLGTSEAYFERYRYARKQTLAFDQGRPFAARFEAVIGASVARELDYAVGQRIVLAHGAGEVNLQHHDEHPFEVVGILRPTGTPVDRTVHVSLASIDAIHEGPRWQGGAGAGSPLERMRGLLRRDAQTPESITAIMMGLNSKLSIFTLQRDINRYGEEALLAVVPGIALQQLWDVMSVGENLLRAISVMVVISGLLGMLAIILSTLESRRREMAILRSMGARPLDVVALFMTEAGALAISGVALGTAIFYGILVAARPLAAREFGVYLPLAAPSLTDVLILAAVVAAGCLMGALPAWRAYRNSLADGLSMRI